MKVSIVLPIHNEQESLPVLIPKLISSTNDLPFESEIICVDDSSTDNSYSILKEFHPESKKIQIIKLRKRGGQTGCYKVAFNKAKGKYIIRMDSDGQDDPDDLKRFVEFIQKGADIIIGLRGCRKHNRMLRFATYIYDIIILLIFNSPLHSNSGSFIAFKSCYVKDIRFRNNDHRYLPIIAIRRGARDIREVIVSHNERLGGKSKYKTLSKLFLGIFEIFLLLIRIKSGYYDTDKLEVENE
jgi:dolichol-phosphate mannosyltransferase